MTSAAGPSTAAARPAPRALGSFVSRALVAVVLASLFGGLAWADATGFGGAAAGWWLLPVALLMAVAGAAEGIGIASTAGLPLRPTAACLGAAAIVGAGFLGAQRTAALGVADPVAALGGVPVGVAVAIAAAFGAEIVGYRPGGRALGRVAAGIMAAVCLGLPFACMLGLRLLCVENLGPEQRGPAHLGMLPLVSFVAVVKAGDIAAYLVGSAIGSRRLAPTLSPGKTWEGALAGLAGSVAAAWIVLELPGWQTPVRPWGGWPVYGLLLGAAGIVGDLCESLVKRECGVKDSGRWLAGLGGVLDLVDSLLLAAPVAWLAWAAATRG